MWAIQLRRNSSVLAAAALICVAAGAAVAAEPLTIPAVPVTLIAVVAVVYFFRDPVGVILGFLTFEVVQTPLAALVGYSGTAGKTVQHADEAMILLLLILSVMRLVLRHEARFSGSRYVLAGLAFAVFGLASDLFQHVPTTVSGVGTWLQLKWWVLLAIGLMAPWTDANKKRVLTFLMRLGLVLSFFGVIDLVAQSQFRAILRTDAVSLSFDPQRSHAVESIFTTPAQFSIVMAMLMTVALAARVTGRRGHYGLYTVMFAVMALLSLRVSAVVAVTTSGFAVWMLGSRSFGTRALAVVGSAALAVVMVGVFHGEIDSHISAYSQPNQTARSVLYSTGETIAAQHAPFGSGFGTFGSGESRLHYSPLYGEYGISEIYGLSPQYPQFIDDTMWPAIIGETGYLGLAAIVIGLLVLARALIRRISAGPHTELFPLAGIGLLVVTLVNSVANPVMFNSLNSILVVLIVAPALLLPVKHANAPAEELEDKGRDGSVAGGTGRWRGEHSRPTGGHRETAGEIQGPILRATTPAWGLELTKSESEVGVSAAEIAPLSLEASATYASTGLRRPDPRRDPLLAASAFVAGLLSGWWAKRR